MKILGDKRGRFLVVSLSLVLLLGFVSFGMQTSYSTIQNDLCPPDTVFNSGNDRCEATPSCPDGSFYNPETNDCNNAEPPFCPPYASYNSETDKCEAFDTPTCMFGGVFDPETDSCVIITPPECPGPFSGTYNEDRDRCESTPQCEGDPFAFYNGETDLCEEPILDSFYPCGPWASINPETDLCENFTSAVCFGGELDFDTDLCTASPCPDEYSFNSDTGLCEDGDENTEEPSCDDPLEFNTSTNICEDVPHCVGPGAGTYDDASDQCEYIAEPSCPEDAFYSDGICIEEYEATCDIGELDPANDVCQVNAICPGPGGKQLDPESDMCVGSVPPFCFGPGGPTYNDETNQCEVIRDPICFDPFEYDADLNLCISFGGLASCPDGTALDTEEDVCALQTLQVDIKPGSDLNPINLKQLKGVIPVAVYGNAFDVSTLDDSTLMFEGAMPSHIQEGLLPEDHTQLVNEDEYNDKVSHYILGETTIVSGQTHGCLTAYTTGGIPAIGCDYFQTKN